MIDKETKEAVPVTVFSTPTVSPRTSPASTTPGCKVVTMIGAGLALLRITAERGAHPLQDRRPAVEVRQVLGATGRNYGKVTGDLPMKTSTSWRRSLELPLHRRHVVPGSLQPTTSAALAEHHPVRHPGGANLLLRVHRRGLAQHHREDAHDLHPHQVVRGARASRDSPAARKSRPRHGDAHLVLNEVHVGGERHPREPSKNAREKTRARDAKLKQTPKTPAWPSSTARKFSRNRCARRLHLAKSSPQPPPPRRSKRPSPATNYPASMSRKGRQQWRPLYVHYSIPIASSFWTARSPESPYCLA